MSNAITINPTPGASTNPLGITFGATAKLEFMEVPERVLNKDISGIELTAVDLTGLYLHKGPLNAVIPWSNVVSLVY